jgi:DNA-binding PadR family transcriptional regulator
VRGRIERFVEPALLLVLRDVETHGYDLADEVEAMDVEERVDLGNMYRLLRAANNRSAASARARPRAREHLPNRRDRVGVGGCLVRPVPAHACEAQRDTARIAR